MEPVPKKSSSSTNCYLKELKNTKKRADLNKLYKGIERVSKRIFHADKVQSTFVPSAQLQSAQSSSSTSSTNEQQMPHQPVFVNPPYPVHPGFGTGFPPLPAQQQIPPSYGWALNGIQSSSIPSNQSAFSMLSLDVGEGNETAGSGFEHLSVHEEPDDYLRPNPKTLTDHKNAQSAKLERVKQQMLAEVSHLNLIANDQTELKKFYDEKYIHLLVDEDSTSTEELEEKVKRLEEKLRRLRSKSPHGGPPPRPPPPRSISQESSTGTWTCARCRTENKSYNYRCDSCSLPSRRFDPSETEKCGCEYCSSSLTE